MFNLFGGFEFLLCYQIWICCWIHCIGTNETNISTVCSSLQCSHLASIFVCHVLLLPIPIVCLHYQQNWVNSELMFMNRCDGSETRCCWGSATPRLQTKRVKVTFASEPADERVHLTRHAASACFDYVQFTSLINLCCCSEEATAWYWFGRCFSHRRCEVGVWRGRGWSRYGWQDVIRTWLTWLIGLIEMWLIMMWLRLWSKEWLLANTAQVTRSASHCDHMSIIKWVLLSEHYSTSMLAPTAPWTR